MKVLTEGSRSALCLILRMKPELSCSLNWADRRPQLLSIFPDTNFGYLGPGVNSTVGKVLNVLEAADFNP